MAVKEPPKAELVNEPRIEIETSNEPPVVARLIVEIRSDGTRTIARGAVEDVQSGQRTTLEARGDSPLALALQLAKVLTQLPRHAFRLASSAHTARSAVRGLLGRRKDKPGNR
jgi:hypothetical protein